MPQLSALHHNASADPVERIGPLVDGLVAALAGDPSAPLRRAQVLVDIADNAGTTMTEIMDRLDLDKSSLIRDLEWLFDHGCILRQASPRDAREVILTTCGYTKGNLESLLPLAGDYKNLQNFINGLMNLTGLQKPTLRDAKIMAVLATTQDATRQDVVSQLYDGPVSTDNRAITNLVNAGIVVTNAESSDD